MMLFVQSNTVVAQSTVVESARSLVEKDRLEGREMKRVAVSFLSLLAVVKDSHPSLVQGPAIRQTAIGDLSDVIKDGDSFWEVKYYNSDTNLISMITFVNDKTEKVMFVCRTYAECAGK